MILDSGSLFVPRFWASISMRETLNTSELVETADGSLTLRHPEHGECFHSLDGALLEARALYVEGSELLTFISGYAKNEAIRILDVGLGLGYNAMATIDALTTLQRSPIQIEIVSLESDVNLFQQLRTGAAVWQATWPVTWKSHCQKLQNPTTADEAIYKARFELPSATVDWVVVLGDARHHQNWQRADQHFDFIWQDPFSPQHNPDLWNADWFKSLHHVANPDQAVLMTYSVARTTKDALDMAGWTCEKIPGRGKKRQWLRALAHNL